MAKPGVNLPEWADASNGGNYTGGPYAGQPRKVSIPGGVAAEGFRPGADDPSAAEHINDWLNKASNFIRWVYDGTSAGTATAHIQETDSAGIEHAQGASFVQSGGPALSQTIYVEDTLTGGPAIGLFGNSGSGPLINILHGNDGSGIEFAGGAFASAVCAGDGIFGISVTATGFESGAAYLETSGEDSDVLTINSSDDGSDGIRATTTGDGSAGVTIFTSGDASDGVVANCSGIAVVGLRGIVDDSASIAVEGTAVHDGQGGRFYAGLFSGVGVTIESFADDGLQVTGGTTNSEAAIRATGKGQATGIVAEGGPTAGSYGLTAAGGIGGGTGIVGQGTGAGGYGVVGSGSGTGYGVYGTGFFGVHGDATSNNGFGCYGTIPVGANPGAAGVFGQSEGAGSGVYGTSDTGTGGKFISAEGNAGRFDAEGAKPTVVVVTRGSDPSSHEDGGIWHRSDGLKVRRTGVTRRFYDTAGGMAFAKAWSASGQVTDTQTVILTATFAGANIPVAVGTVLIRVALEVGRNSGTPNCRMEITSSVDGILLGDLETITLHEAAGAGAFERHLAYEYSHLLTAAGAQSFTVTLYSTVPGNDINYRNAGMTVIGVF